MRIRSTGLGKTELFCVAEGFSKNCDYAVLNMKAMAPVKWRIRVAMSAGDLLKLLGTMLKAIGPIIIVLIRGLKKNKEVGDY